MTPRYDIEAAVTHLRAADPALAHAIEVVGPPSMRETDDPYAALVRAILYQQLAGKAAATIERRFYALYSDQHTSPAPDQLLATDDEALRSAGVSRQKAGYLRDLAAKTRDGVIGPGLHDLSDEESAARVMSVKGVGRWTADMLLMFTLGRPDVLPVGDLGFRTAVKRLYDHDDLPDVDTLRSIAEPWRPYRSLATWYCWQWHDAGGVPPQPV